MAPLRRKGQVGAVCQSSEIVIAKTGLPPRLALDQSLQLCRCTRSMLYRQSVEVSFQSLITRAAKLAATT